MPEVQIINMQKSRVIECLAVCGIDPELENSIDITQQLKAITGLELVSEPAYDSEKDKYIEINNRLYLRVLYDRNRPPISEIQFLTPQIADNSVKISESDWTPVFIRGEDRVNRMGDFNANSVNIRAYLDNKQNQQQALVLCYRSDESCEMAICDIEVLQGDKRQGRRSQQQKDILNVPHEYKTVNHAFVIRNRNKYLIYRRMHSKLDSTYKPTIMELYPQKRTNRDMTLESLPSFCFPEGIRLSEEERGFISFSFILTLQTLQRIYCSCLIFKQLLSKHVIRKLGFKKDQPYYCEKALCIVSEFSYPDQYCELLQQIYRIGMSKNDVPFYKVVQNLVDDMVMIEPQQWGKMAMRYTYGGCKIVLETRARFPVVSDKSIYCLFKFLQVDKIISVFESILLEKKILLISQSKTVLGLVCQALMGVVFPFKWEQTIIPVLPLSMRDYTQAPVPFIIGIPPNFSDIEYEKQCIIVDLDNNEIVNDEALPPMPDKMVKQLHKRLLQYEVYVREHTKEYLENPQNRYIFQMLQQADSDNVNFDPFDIRDAFFEFMLTLMKNYLKFWKKGKKQASYKDTSTLGLDPAAQSLDELYNVQDFLSDLNMTKIGSFGYKFTETSIFSTFIETRAREPKNAYFIFFQECLEKKKAKKEAKFITFSKNEKFWDCPFPNWPSQAGVYYSYQKLPSILSPKEQVGGVGQEDIDIQIEPNSERFRQDNRRQKAFLDDKCLVYRGFYTSGTNYGLPKELMQVDISEELRDIMMKLFMKDEISFIAELIGKSLGGSSKAANESAVLAILVQKFMQQQKFMERVIKGWDYSEKQARYRVQIISTVALPMKALAQKQQDRQVITAEQIYDDIQSISFQKTNIMFYPSQSHRDMKRIYIKVDNSIMKGILNNILHKQLESFTRFVLEKYSTCDILIWTCEELRKFRKWLS